MTLKSATPTTHTKHQIPSSLSPTKVWESDKRTRRVTVHYGSHNFMPLTKLCMQDTQYIFKIKAETASLTDPQKDTNPCNLSTKY